MFLKKVTAVCWCCVFCVEDVLLKKVCVCVCVFKKEKVWMIYLYVVARRWAVCPGGTSKTGD